MLKAVRLPQVLPMARGRGHGDIAEDLTQRILAGKAQLQIKVVHLKAVVWDSIPSFL